MRRRPVSPPSSAELEALPAKDRQEVWDAHRRRRFEMTTSLITSIGVLLSVAFTAFGLIYTARTLQSTQEGQITDRYTKAVEQLASPSVDVRLGAIYALQRIAVDSPKDRLTVRNVLAAFVRDHDFCTAQPPATQCAAPITDLVLARSSKLLPADVYAALTTASSLSTGKDDLADFSESRFPRVYFPQGADLRYADLHDADLTFAGLYKVNLMFVDASGACLTAANLTGADLSHADLRGADLSLAQLSGANLSGADLRGADLRSVFGMSPDEIRSVAMTDSSTDFGEVRLSQVSQGCGPLSAVGLVLHPHT